MNQNHSSRFLSYGVSFALMYLIVATAQAGPSPCPPICDIEPGISGLQVFRLGDDVMSAVAEFKKKYKFEEAEIGSPDLDKDSFDTGQGVKLYYKPPGTIDKIVITAPGFTTDQGTGVYARLEDVLLGYGDAYEPFTFEDDDGYYIKYPDLGIGFDIDGTTEIVRAIVVFVSERFQPDEEISSSAADIKNCPPDDWCAYHRTVNRAWRHSPLKQINKDNVTQLRPAWIFMPGEAIGLHSTPLAVEGNIYVATNSSTVWKLNGATGERIWAAFAEEVESSKFAHVRGLAIGDGRVYTSLGDGRVAAIDEETGETIWDRKLANFREDTSDFSGAGTFVNSDLLVIGQNGGDYPAGGRIFGLDPKNGNLNWTFYTAGRGDPSALATWGGDSWKYGGGSWQPGTVDYENNQIVMGTSRPNPKANDWDNLYTSSMAALDLDTGKLNWYFQEAPSDPYDYGPPLGEYIMLEDYDQKLVLHPGNNGFNHVYEAKSGKSVNVYPDQDSQNWTSGFNLETGEWENMQWPKAGESRLVCPAIDGGHSWNPGTYNPQTGLFYRVVSEWCMFLTVAAPEPEGGDTTITSGTETRVTKPFAQVFMAAEWVGADPPDDKTHGRITARHPVTGDMSWYKRYDIIPHSALMSTASGLVFNATMDGFVEALDAESGDTLWRFNNGTSHNGGIISYAADGKQYVAVAAGHGSYVGSALAGHYHKDPLINYHESAAVVAFALP